MSKQLEKPTGFFEKDYLRLLEYRFFSRRISGRNMENLVPYEDLVALAKEATELSIDLHKVKTLDLGAGHGMVMAAFALHGCPVYGVDRESQQISFLKKAWRELPIEKPPQILYTDYFDQAFFKQRFPDGTRISDIDFFFCHTYSSKHANSVLVTCLGGRGKAKIGSFVCIRSTYRLLTDDLLREAGFEKLPRKHGGSITFLRKVKSPKLSQRFIDSFDYEKAWRKETGLM